MTIGLVGAALMCVGAAGMIWRTSPWVRCGVPERCFWASVAFIGLVIFEAAS